MGTLALSLVSIGADDSVENYSEDSVDNEEEISLEDPAKKRPTVKVMRA